MGEYCNVITDALGSEFKIVANDSSYSKCTDSIVVNGKGKLEFVSSKINTTNGIYTDHNMVTAIIAAVN